MPLIEVEDVRHTYGTGTAARTVLSGVSVRATEQRIGVIGANGSGKSTFARLLNGLVLPTAGQVRVAGYDTASKGREVRRRVGFCFTDPDAQIVMPTVAEDVAFGLRRTGMGKAEVAARVTATLEAYGLAGHADHPAHLLSGGQKQLLALSSVLVTEPDVLDGTAEPHIVAHVILTLRIRAELLHIRLSHLEVSRLVPTVVWLVAFRHCVSSSCARIGSQGARRRPYLRLCAFRLASTGERRR